MRPEASTTGETCSFSIFSFERGISLALMTMLLLLGAAAGAEQSAEQLAQIQQQLSALEKRLNSAKSELEAVREQSFELNRVMSLATTEVLRLDQQIRQKSERIEALRQSVTGLKTQSRKLLHAVVRSAGMHYVVMRQPKLKLLLNQSDAGQMSRVVAYQRYIGQSFEQDLTELNTKLTKLEQIAAALKLENSQLRQLRQNHADDINRLTPLLEQQTQLSERLHEKLNTDEARLQGLKIDEQRLLELVKRIKSTQPTKPENKAFATLKGKLNWPAPGKPANAPGKALRAGGARWAGVLLKAKPGSEVKAVAAGEVVYADWFRNLGKLIIVDHGNGYLSLYGNNADVYVSDGDSVSQGDTIASVGSGGGEMPAGAYFELRANGQPVDPRRWIAKR